MKTRKPYGVWMLLYDGSPWMFDRHRTLDEALRTARTLRGDAPLPQVRDGLAAMWDEAPPAPVRLFARTRHEVVWIAPPSRVGTKAAPVLPGSVVR